MLVSGGDEQGDSLGKHFDKLAFFPKSNHQGCLIYENHS